MFRIFINHSPHQRTIVTSHGVKEEFAEYLEVRVVDDVDQNVPIKRRLGEHVSVISDTEANHKHKRNDQEVQHVRQL